LRVNALQGKRVVQSGATTFVRSGDEWKTVREIFQQGRQHEEARRLSEMIMLIRRMIAESTGKTPAQP